MGADLYISGREFEAARASHHREFEALIKQRNAIAVPHYVGHDAYAYLDGDKPYAELDRHVKAWLRTVDGKAYVAAQRAINKNMESQPGYFRDSYNNSSIMWRLGLSWWAIAGVGQDEPSPIIDDNGVMSVEACKALRQAVKAAKIKPMVQGAPVELKGEKYADSAAQSTQEWIDGMSEKEVADWNKFFVSKKKKLVKFLTDAINANAAIDASV